jgi:drug/metabolite transporter (DMT)-like permease
MVRFELARRRRWWPAGAVIASSIVRRTAQDRTHVLPWLALITVWIVWGSTYLGIRAAVDTIPPLLMAGFRFLLAGAVMVAIVGPRQAKASYRLTWRHMRSAFVVGALMLVGGNGLVSVGETALDSSLAALIVATVPVWMVVIDALMTRTRITKPTVLALVLGTVGVGLVVGGPGGQVDAGWAMVVLVASVFWAAGSVYARRAPLPSDPLFATSLEMLAAGVMLIVAGTATGELRRFDLAAISTGSLVGFLWLVVAGSMLAFNAYIYANATLPNDTVATYAYVNPVVAVALGSLLGREPLSLNLLFGGGVIVSAVVIIMASRSRAVRRRSESAHSATVNEPVAASDA